MSIFLLVYILIYSAMNGYAYCRLFPLLPDNRTVRWLVSFSLMSMVPAPILLRVLERGGWESGLTMAGMLTFSWMGFLFVFVVLSLALEFLRLLFWLGKRFLAKGLPWPVFTSQNASLAGLVLSVVFFAYGLFEAQNLRQEHVVLTTAKLPPGVDRLRIVQVSDIHLGLLAGERTLSRIIQAVNEADPDLLVSTGDLVDSSPHSLMQEAEMWEGVKPRLGKWAVTGNHEFYAGIEESIRFTHQSGFTLLRDEALVVGPLRVIGIDDHHFGKAEGRSQLKYNGQQDKEDLQRFILLLQHRPGPSPLYAGSADLQLSGHTHQGQIFPFGLFTHMAFPFPGGLSGESGRWFYISRGTGTWGPPIRVFSPPEITVVDLVRSPVAEGDDGNSSILTKVEKKGGDY